MIEDDERLPHVRHFYSLLSDLEKHVGGMRRLSVCTGRMRWPQRGVYFFFEDGEARSDSGDGPRVVRVGTHALTTGSSTRLWHRLSQHRGSLRSGGGNHRGSIFRLIAGEALLNRHPEFSIVTWGRGSTAGAEVRLQEGEHERRVSDYLGAMSLLWIDLADAPGMQSLRGMIERNAISLLSNYHRPPIDSPSSSWLGHHSGRAKVRESGLWNQKHVDEEYNPTFLDTMETAIVGAERMP